MPVIVLLIQIFLFDSQIVDSFSYYCRVYDDVTNKLKIIIDENERLTKEKEQV